MLVRNISQSHRRMTYLIELMFATLLLLLKKPISTVDYNVVICLSCYFVLYYPNSVGFNIKCC